MATSYATATLQVELPELQDALQALRNIDPKDSEVEKAQDLLDKIPPDASENEVKRSGLLPKIKRVLKKAQDAETKLGKAVKATESGVKNLQKLGKAYNAIAEWTAIPTIPQVLLGKGESRKTGDRKP